MTPLDDQPANTIARRAQAVRGEVEEYRRRARPGDAADDPQPEDIERFSGVTVRCAECGGEALDEVEICPHCGHAILDRERGKPTMPAVAAVIAVLVIVAMLILLAVAGQPLFG